MFKILLISILFLYAIIRISGFITRILGYGSNQQNQRPPRDGNIRVDSNTDRNQKHYDGGEYVDYEEVK